MHPDQARKPPADLSRQLALLLAQARRRRVDISGDVRALERRVDAVERRLDQR